MSGGTGTRSGVNPAFRLFQKEMQVHMRTIYTELAYVILFPIMLLWTMRLGIGDRVDIQGLDYIDFIMPGIIVMSVITTAFFNTGFVMLFEKEYAGSFNGLVITPIRPVEIVFGKLLSGSVKATINGLLIVLVLVAAVDYRPPWTFALLPPLLLLGSFLFAALGMMFGVVLRKGYQLGTIGNLIIVPLTFMGGMFFDVDSLEGPVASLVRLSPVTHMIGDAREVMIFGGTDIWGGATVVVLLSVAAFHLAVAIFTREVYR